MKLLITGGAGFIGSALVRRAVAEGHQVLTIDKLTYAGRRDALNGLPGAPVHRFVQADIADAGAMQRAFDDFAPNAVLHLAAETHVDRSIDDPGVFVQTNVVGTATLLAVANRHWTARGRDRFLFLQVSTDEVFGSLGETGAFHADSRYRPNSPYAASKAAADHFARAWHRTYGLPVAISHCSNNFGPRQHAEKLIPTVIRHAIAGQPVPIYGTGLNRRDWLYVDDHVDGLLRAAETGRAGETHLFGGGTEMTNLDLARATCAVIDELQPGPAGGYAEQIALVADRSGHDFRYAIDPGETVTRLGWTARTGFEQGLRQTVSWYLEHPEELTPPHRLGRLGLGDGSAGGAGL